jgi:hypothetical protein
LRVVRLSFSLYIEKQVPTVGSETGAPV